MSVGIHTDVVVVGHIAVGVAFGVIVVIHNMIVGLRVCIIGVIDMLVLFK